MIKHIKKFGFLVLVSLLVCNVMATEVVGDKGINPINYSDLTVLRNIREEMLKSQDPGKFFADLPEEAQKALAQALSKVKYDVKTTVNNQI